MPFDPTAVPDIVAAWRRENAGFAELIRTADPQTPVPTCPGWTLGMLTRHVGRGDRWAASMVAQRAEKVLDPREVPGGKPPAGVDAAADWLLDGVGLLVDAVESVGPDAPVWTFTGPKPSSWWLRRRLCECLVHHADAALALGAPFDVPAEVAADAVSEWLMLLASRPAGEEPLLPGDATMHLHATDPDLGPKGEWMVHPCGNAVTWEPGHAKGTVALRGPAVDLLLVLLRRLPAERIEVLGEPSVLDTWLARTGF